MLAHHAQQLAHEVQRVDGDALALHAPGERQHLLDDSAPRCALLRMVVSRPSACLVGDRLLQHVDRHQDRREHVVQVVGDAAGQRADALQPLRAEEPRFERLALADVGVDLQDGAGLVARVPHESPPRVHRNSAAIFRPLDDLTLPLAVGMERSQRGAKLFGILVEQIDGRAPHRFRRPPSERPLRALVPVDDAPVQIDSTMIAS